MTVGIIIQARMGSTRLPGKMLLKLDDAPLISHVVMRANKVQPAVTTTVATSRRAADDAIARWCEKQGVACFRGSEQDVLARYVECAREQQFQHIVRLTGDNPFTDVEELSRLIAFHIQGGYDYSHSFGQMPVGVGAEIFTWAALERSHREGHARNHREHVNEYIEENPHLFSIGRLEVPAEKIALGLRLTVDTPDDFARAEALCRTAQGRILSTQELIALCSHSA